LIGEPGVTDGAKLAGVVRAALLALLTAVRPFFARLGPALAHAGPAARGRHAGHVVATGEPRVSTPRRPSAHARFANIGRAVVAGRTTIATGLPFGAADHAAPPTASEAGPAHITGTTGLALGTTGTRRIGASLARARETPNAISGAYAGAALGHPTLRAFAGKSFATVIARNAGLTARPRAATGRAALVLAVEADVAGVIAAATLVEGAALRRRRGTWRQATIAKSSRSIDLAILRPRAGPPVTGWRIAIAVAITTARAGALIEGEQAKNQERADDALDQARPLHARHSSSAVHG
jgi:hypothetical protein